MSTADHRLRRATLIGGSASPASSLTELLRQLASLSVESIAGVFVEDRALLRAAALPSIRQIGRVSGMLQSLELSAIETSLRRQAERLRGELAAMAAEMQRPWSFDITQGDIVAEAFGHAARARVAVLRAANRQVSAGGGALDRDAGRGAIIVVPDTVADDRLLDVAVALANAGHRRLSVYLPNLSLPAADLRRRLADVLDTPLTVTAYADTPALVRMLLRYPDRALVLPAATMTSMPEAFEPVLRQFGLSILLLD